MAKGVYSMKKVSVFLLWLSCSPSLFSQNELVSDGLLPSDMEGTTFSTTFKDMFVIENGPAKEYLPQEVGNPAVPLDGGLTALLLAGGAAGYRQYKKKKA